MAVNQENGTCAYGESEKVAVTIRFFSLFSCLEVLVCITNTHSYSFLCMFPNTPPIVFLSSSLFPVYTF